MLDPYKKEDHQDLSDKTKTLDDLLAHNHNLYRINEKVDNGDRKGRVEKEVEVEKKEEAEEAELKGQVAQEHDRIREHFYTGMASFLDKQYFSYPRTEFNQDSYDKDLDLLKERLKKRADDQQLNSFDSKAAQVYLSKLEENDMKELFIIISTCKKRGEPLTPTPDEDKTLSEILSRIGLHKIPPRSVAPP